MMQRFREPVSGFTHLIGAVLGAVGLIVLVLLTHDDPPRLLSMVVYGASLIALYTASTVMHLSHGPKRRLDLLRSLDHAGINLLIAGTYTPLCYNLLTGYWRWGLLGAVWALAVVGAVYKVAYRHREHGYLSTVIYVGMGWLAVAAMPHVFQVVPLGALLLVLAGGLVYSMGAVVFALKRPNLHPHFGHHELWHLFVLGGSAIHFAAIALYAAR